MSVIGSIAARHWHVLVPLALFLALATPRLDRPGLHYDEALEAATPAVQLLAGQPTNPINGGALRLGGIDLPLMVQNHIGAVQVYAALPFVALGGPTAPALRAMTVAAGAATVLAVYLFVAQVYGRLAGASAALWLATFASFVFWSRQGVFVTSLAPCFAAWALAAGARWWRVRRPWLIGLAGLCAGLAVYSKLSALWLLNGTLAWGALALFVPRQAAGPRMAFVLGLSSLVASLVRYRRHVLAGLLGFGLGVWPLALYNMLTGGATWRVVQGSATTTYLGTSNLDVLGNLGTRLAQFADVLRSGEHLWYLGGTYPNDISLASAVAALLLLLADTARRRGRGWRSGLFAPFLALAAIAQSCFTISALWPTHFAIAVILPAIAVGAAAGRAQAWLGATTDHRQPTRDKETRRQGDKETGRQGDKKKPPSSVVGRRSSAFVRRWLVPLLLVVVVVSQFLTSLAYLRAASTTGGLSFHSSAIYDLSRFLDGRPEHVVALDWGISAPVEYLTGGRVRVEEFYGYSPAPPDFVALLRERAGRDELYVTHAQYQEAFERRAAFLAAAAEAGLVAETVNVSIRADGWPLLEVWRVRPAQVGD